MTTLVAVIGAIATLVSALSVGTLIKFFVERRDAKNDNIKELIEKIDNLTKENDKKFTKLEKDIVRTQLLQLMQNYATEEEHELLQVAEHYFDVLNGDWYMTSMFKKFLKKQNIEIPLWFKEDTKEK